MEGSAHGNQQAARLMHAAYSHHAPDADSPAPAAGRLEGSWHGPLSAAELRRSLTQLSSPAALAPGSRPAPGSAILGDETWHGGARGVGGAGTGGAAALAALTGAHPSEVQRFLEQARQRRQEQRKVARLVLEGSTRGGREAGVAAAAAAREGRDAAGGGGGGGLLHKLRTGVARALGRDEAALSGI
ncbi:hypothetical protein MNEG_10618 [Monoraphidium neglectum]|uniref:Uncharacterized protein n=1 Tax=Monoraphidium neglectum TaxID=145388 RepID=A0A0D2M897_9CHLO|nr:hypothetical protein MNEG_10618 [Monoraphidium neglectum]KIY97346.1 hypothetical protein MNEG_10618 [Monoraphidium neglectum]|eukprot:XP_013896366.1 hypothetical protein MNEG_10618 [Monoraphidium neglectum]